MKAYLDILQEILDTGVEKENRTGINTFVIPGATFKHDMSDGFPLLTTKKVYFKGVASELEFFIKGLTDKRWLQDNGNHIWDDWCSPLKVPYGHDDETKQKMKDERDLGPIYGFQWRYFGAEYKDYKTDYTNKGIDQLSNLIETIKTDPGDRRMLVTAWNPLDISKMALPPCHYGFQVTVLDGKLNLFWNQRSVDTPLGLPFNIASYALLLHLLAKETGLKEGMLIGYLGDVHFYKNQLDGVKEQLTREPKALPKVETREFTSIFDWKYTDTEVLDYDPHPTIKFEIAV
jgi:thymidylate synthase